MIADIGELSRSETAAMISWPEAGCAGPEPEPDQRQRKQLAEKLQAASAAAAAARGAGTDVDQKILETSNRIRAITAELDETALVTAEAEWRAVLAEYRTHCEAGQRLAAQLHGLALFYGETGRGLLGRGDQDGGTAYVRRSTALGEIKLPTPGVTRHEIEAAALVWSRRIDELRSGT